MSERHEQVHEQGPRIELPEQTKAVILSEVNRLMEEGSREGSTARSRDSFTYAGSLLSYLGNPTSAQEYVSQTQPAAAPAEQPTQRMAAAPDVAQTQPIPAVSDEEKSLWDIAKERTARKFESFGLRRTRLAKAAGVVAVSAVAFIAGYNSSSNATGDSVVEGTARAALVSSESQEANVESGWEQDELTPNEENRWLESGFPNIKKAETKKEAREAVNQWLGVMKGDEDAFKFIYDQVHGGDIEKAKLFENGQSTPYADQRLKELQYTLTMSDIRKGDAAEDVKNPHNTGLDGNGDVVVASNGGVSGDTEAVIVETMDGKVIAVMHRCAQPVVPGKPGGVPEGLTDQGKIIPNEQPKEEEVCPPAQVILPNGNCGHHAAGGPPPGVIQYPADPGPTPGYPGRGHAEDIVGSQQGDPTNLDPTPHGTEVPNSKGGGKAPGGGDQSVISEPPATAPNNPEYDPGTTSPGTDEGTSNPAPTEGSDQTSNPGTDPGMPGN